MAIPGFTADFAVCTSRNTYGARSERSAASGVVPQQDGGKEPGDPCRGACRCCAIYQYQGCCALCDDCFVRHVAAPARFLMT
jgi:hypothetical protein